ncbi:Pr6Pr family membrane protein [Actinoplanes sp. NPDC051633]|uniref:Pr6Pr family membrane protein n=1 Tax=Actinoplanes sp. NPDC051633 TaxID=3155670 RepID=UPI003412D6CD
MSHFLLNNGASPLPGLVVADPSEALSNRATFLLHYVVPIMVLIDWLAFGPHRVSPWRDLPLWLIFPLGYGIASILRAVLAPAAPYRYPYFFLDPTDHGYGWVALQMLQLAVEFAALGAILLALDRLAAKLTSARLTSARLTSGSSAVHAPVEQPAELPLVARSQKQVGQMPSGSPLGPSGGGSG